MTRLAPHTGSVGVLGPVALGYVLPMLPDGTGWRISADKVAEYTFTYQQFRPAWRLTNATSLFDYASGKSTASYDVPGFVPSGGPPKTVAYGSTSPFDPLVRASAETSCAGIDDVSLRNECVDDVATTGDAGFVDSYQATAGFLATEASSPASSGGSSGGPTIQPLINDTRGVRGAVVGPDGALDVVVMVASGPEIVAVDPATTTIRTQMPLNAQDAGSVVVASGSLWVMVTTGPGTCAVDRIDPASLKVTGQATPPVVPICGLTGPGGSWRSALDRGQKSRAHRHREQDSGAEHGEQRAARVGDVGVLDR